MIPDTSSGYRNIEAPQNKAALGRHIAAEIRAGQQFTAAVSVFRAALTRINSPLGFLHGWDRATILDLIDRDLTVPPIPDIQTYAINHCDPENM